MGLDMYLLKQKKHSILSSREIDYLVRYLTCKKRGIKDEEIVKNNETVFDDINKIAGKIEMNINDINTLERYLSPYQAQHIGYWRKANQIHKWFVDNIQDGIDDQKIYEISEEELKTLLKICTDIKETCILNDKEMIENVDIPKKLLPTCEGFFFGSYGYDKNYLLDIEDTISIVSNVLKEVDFDEEVVEYTSWW